jgi:hypothetical protein
MRLKRLPMTAWLKQLSFKKRILVIGSFLLNLFFLVFLAYGLYLGWVDRNSYLVTSTVTIDPNAIACCEVHTWNKIPQFNEEEREILRIFYQALDFEGMPPNFQNYYVESLSDIYYTGETRHKGEGIYVVLLKSLHRLQDISVDSTPCRLPLDDSEWWFIFNREGKILNQGDWFAKLKTRENLDAPWPFARHKCKDGAARC